MISIMELMEKITPLNRKTIKKKGMTLVELMAAMAILSIIIVGVSSFMLGITKSEHRSNKYLDTTNYLKAALDSFKLKAGGDISEIDDTRAYYIEKDKFESFIDKDSYVYFDNMDEMLKKLVDANFQEVEELNYTTKYQLKANVTKVTDKDLYLVKVEMKYSGDDISSKELYINR